jgi:hypothetical protein
MAGVASVMCSYSEYFQFNSFDVKTDRNEFRSRYVGLAADITCFGLTFRS